MRSGVQAEAGMSSSGLHSNGSVPWYARLWMVKTLGVFWPRQCM